jgi:hypothetical protein
MADDKLELNLLKMIASSIYFSVGMQAAREMYGKSYFSLGVAEKAALDQMVQQQVNGNFQVLNPDLPMFQTDQKPVGFQNPTVAKTESLKSEAS